MANNKPRSPVSQAKIEGIVFLVGEWISFREMKALQQSGVEGNVRRMATIPDGKRREPSFVIHVRVQRCDLNIVVSCWAKTTESKEGPAASFAG